jgi:hypothetical protein
MATSFGLAWILCLALAASAASATQFRVGDDKGWSVPAAGAEPLNAWAGRMRFQIGDQLRKFILYTVHTRMDKVG